MPCRVIGAVNHHSEAAIDDLAPADPAAIVDRYPRCTTETVPYDVLDGHVGSKLGAVVNVRSLPERGIGA